MGSSISKDFSKKVLTALAKKEISIVGSQAVPAFEGDVYFQDVAYILVWNETQFLRTYSQVNVLAVSSWCPEEFFSESVPEVLVEYPELMENTIPTPINMDWAKKYL